MATNTEIQKFVQRHHGFISKMGWIAHVKEVHDIPTLRAMNRARRDRLPFAFQGPRTPQENDTTKRIQAFAAASAVRPRRGFRQNARLMEHTGPVRTGKSRFHPPVNAGEALPGYSRQDMLVVPVGGSR